MTLGLSLALVLRQAAWEGICKDTWKRKFKLPWREAGPTNNHGEKVDSDQQVVN